MPSTLALVDDRVTSALQHALPQLAAAVPRPRTIRTASGLPAYRYIEATSQQAIVLKSVRVLSALRSAEVNLRAGLVLDVGASMRILDELGSNIMFLAGPLLGLTPSEPRHAQFLTEFFQEEFDHPDPLQSTQRRNRVSRRDVRAYVARAYQAPNFGVSDIVNVTETIDNAFSGYIHGAAGHIMDVFDGVDFCVPVEQATPPIACLTDQLAQYLHRAIMSFEVSAKALGLDELNMSLRSLSNDLFTAGGDLK
jgi:hypothetical protein